MIPLRGHHLFCLVGYRGIGYSEDYAINMTKVHEQIRQYPKTLIEIVNGPDCLCDKFPKDGDYHCENKNIYDRDSAILQMLHLQIGQIVTWEEIENRLRKYVTPSVIETVCQTCSWKPFGVCEEGMKRICNGESLKEVK